MKIDIKSKGSLKCLENLHNGIAHGRVASVFKETVFKNDTVMEEGFLPLKSGTTIVSCVEEVTRIKVIPR